MVQRKRRYPDLLTTARELLESAKQEVKSARLYVAECKRILKRKQH